MHENRETSETPAANQAAGRWAKATSRKAHAHVSEESDSGVVPVKRLNKAGRPAAEGVEGRPLTKENTHQASTQPTQGGDRVSQGLAGVRRAASARKGEKFTALLHHVTPALLKDSFYALKREAAAGVDGVRWQEYVDHEWMMRFLQHRIADRRVLRLIQKWLKAGVSEDGTWSETKVGTPQGAVVSPLLANIYLHYVFDLWVEAWRKKCARGDVIVVRYVDDPVMGFEHRSDAERFLEDLGARLRKFGLELHPDKTRLIEFGRHAARSRKQRGEKKPESFDFLGFTHLCGKTSKQGRFMVLRKTAG